MDHEYSKLHPRPMPLRSWRPSLFGVSQRRLTCREAYLASRMEQARKNRRCELRG